MRKIDLMHKLFGKSRNGLLCSECKHFYRKDARGTLRRKCEVYGDSNSEATDWKATYPACGLAPDKPYSGKPVVELSSRGKEPAKPLEVDGQISFFKKGEL